LGKMKVFCKKCGKEAEIHGHVVYDTGVIDMEFIKIDSAEAPSWVYLTGIYCPRCKVICDLFPFDEGLIVDLIDGRRLKYIGEELWEHMVMANIDGDLKEKFELKKRE